MKLYFSLSLLFIAVPCILFGQTDTQFLCPMKKARIVIEHKGDDNAFRKPGAVFTGKNLNVYSCSAGIVEGVDTSGRRIALFIRYENYLFSYFEFESLAVVEGQTIKKGEFIGKLKENDRLFLIVSKDKVLIEPETILKCKVIHEFTK